MFDDPRKRTFFSAPQSVTTFVAALLEPGITVVTFAAATLAGDPPMGRPALAICLLVLALTFPGRNRFGDNLLGAAVDILSSWVVLPGPTSRSVPPERGARPQPPTRTTFSMFVPPG